MPDLADLIRTHNAPLEAVTGPRVPEADDATLARAEDAVAQAEQAVAGIARRDDAGPGWTKGLSPHLLPALAGAWRRTGDERFARAAAAVYRYWLDAEPLDPQGRWVPEGAGPDALLIAHRLGATEAVGWMGCLPVLADARAFDDDLLDAVVRSAAGQLGYLIEHLHDGRNIRMTQLDSLYTNGVRLGFLAQAATWRQVGALGMGDMFNRMIQADGSSVEATGWYHFIVMNMALRYHHLRQTLDDAPMPLTPEHIARSVDYTLACVAPDGHFNRLGDCTAHLSPRMDLAGAVELRARHRAALDLPESPQPLAQRFPDAGQIVGRDGWTADATCIAFDATERDGYHWHPARNAVQLWIRGRRVLADPGRMHYDRSKPQRVHAVTTAAHNTVTLNGADQIETPARCDLHEAAGYTLITGLYHGGYWPIQGDHTGPGVYGSHHRTVLWVHGRFVAVLDHVRHAQHDGEKPSMELTWQFEQGQVTLNEAERVAQARFDDIEATILLPLVMPDATISLHEGELNPTAGWVADLSDQPAPAPVIRVTAPEVDFWDTHLATVIMLGPDQDNLETRVVDAQAPVMHRPGRLVLRSPSGQVDEIHWTRRHHTPIEASGDLISDAGLAHVSRNPAGAIGQAFVHRGSYLVPLLSPAPERGAQTFRLR